MYNEKNIEVLIMDQDIDQFDIPSINKYISVTNIEYIYK